MRIRATVEYEVDPKDYHGGSEAILDQEQCRLNASLAYLWVIHSVRRSSGTNVEIRVEEIK